MFKKIEIRKFRIFEDKTLYFGEYITVISGRNSTGKSLLLGLVANSGELKKDIAKTYTGKQFRAEFSELFKGSKTFDQSESGVFKITLGNKDEDLDYRSFRIAWQNIRKKNKLALSEKLKEVQQILNDVNLSNLIKETDTIINKESLSLEDQSNLDLSGKLSSVRESFNDLLDSVKKSNILNDKNFVVEERFRLIPKKEDKDTKKKESKFECPVIYLGLSRLFPLGEAESLGIESNETGFKSDEDKKWFHENYKQILSINDNIENIKNYSIQETDKKQGIGITTSKYDYLTNSSGQDNVGQILLALLSFKNYNREHKDDLKQGILLIDEFDATLHPAAQSRLFKLLYDEAKENKYQVMLTTHSLSLLKDVCQKVQHNENCENTINNIELYYLTTANRQLNIRRNPDYTTIENDLKIQSLIQNSNRVTVVVEDKEAKWFLDHILSGNNFIIKVNTLSLGYVGILTLCKEDFNYCKSNIVVLDGDVKTEEIDEVKNDIPNKFFHILKFPGNVSPEQSIYDCIITSTKESKLWEELNYVDASLTWQYFRDNGPLSQEYNKYSLNRLKYKEWFKRHKEILDRSNVFEYWRETNKKDIDKFIEDFKKLYNKMADNLFIQKIK